MCHSVQHTIMKCNTLLSKFTMCSSLFLIDRLQHLRGSGFCHYLLWYLTQRLCSHSYKLESSSSIIVCQIKLNKWLVTDECRMLKIFQIGDTHNAQVSAGQKSEACWLLDTVSWYMLQFVGILALLLGTVPGRGAYSPASELKQKYIED